MGKVGRSGSAWGHGSLGLDRKDHQAGWHAMTETFGRLSERWMWLANVTILLSFVIIATYAADRATPFKVLTMEPLQVARGETATFKATVWRDTTRSCAAEFSRFIFDSAGSRHDLGNSNVTAEMIQSMEKAAPGKLTISVQIPQSVALGQAKLVTALQYRCNKVHAIWPIETTTELPFTVLP
jgi:hypothetical protein